MKGLLRIAMLAAVVLPASASAGPTAIKGNFVGSCHFYSSESGTAGGTYATVILGTDSSPCAGTFKPASGPDPARSTIGQPGRAWLTSLAGAPCMKNPWVVPATLQLLTNAALVWPTTYTGNYEESYGIWAYDGAGTFTYTGALKGAGRVNAVIRIGAPLRGGCWSWSGREVDATITSR